MKIVSAAEMREIDRVSSERFGVPSLTLMENAGSAVAEFVLARYPDAKRIGVICGKGNNGGDGFVGARKLHQAGREVVTLLLADRSELRGDAGEMFGKLPLTPLFVRAAEELKGEPVRVAFQADLWMEREDIGLELAKTASQLRPRPVIMIFTGYGSITNARGALGVPVDYFAMKPLDLDELKGALHRLLAARPGTKRGLR